MLGVLLVAGVLVGTKVEQFRAMGEAGARMVPPTEVVTAAAARADEWERTIAATGSPVAFRGATVRPGAAGRIERIELESGDVVAAGDVLVGLDTATGNA